MANPNEPKDQTKKHEEAVAGKVEVNRKTPEMIAETIKGNVLLACKNNEAMPDVRRNINTVAQAAVLNLNDEEKKELSKQLREKFERLKQFMEAAHQEVISLTSQIGWN